jgi:seryl-tRNA synthetase
MMIRRLKSEVLSQLPRKRRQRIIIAIDKDKAKKISKLLNKVKNWDEDIEKRTEEENKKKEEISKKLNNYEFDQM